MKSASLNSGEKGSEILAVPRPQKANSVPYMRKMSYIFKRSLEILSFCTGKCHGTYESKLDFGFIWEAHGLSITTLWLLRK